MLDGGKEIFEAVARKHGTKVIAVTDDGKILINQEEQPGKLPFIALPGGLVEFDEDPGLAARRELLEETGYEAGHFELLASHRAGFIDTYMHFWIARDLRKVAEPALDAGGEKITTVAVSWDEFCELLFSETLKQIDLNYIFLKHHRLDPTLSALKKQILG